MDVGTLITKHCRGVLSDETAAASDYTFPDTMLIGLVDWAEAMAIMIYPYEASRALQVEAAIDVAAPGTSKVLSTVDLTTPANKPAQIITAEFKYASGDNYVTGKIQSTEDFFADQSPGHFTKGTKMAPHWAIWGTGILLFPGTSGTITGGCNLRYLVRPTVKTTTGAVLEIGEEYQRSLFLPVCSVAFARIGAANEAQLLWARWADYVKMIGGRWDDDLMMTKRKRVASAGR